MNDGNNTSEYNNIISDNNQLQLTKNIAIERVINIAMTRGYIARGISEVLKAMETHKVQCIFLAENIDDDRYKQTILAFAKQMIIPIVYVDLWENLKDYCKLGMPCAQQRQIALAKGKPVKIKPKCSSCAIIEWGVESEEKKYLEQFFCYIN